jgi:hypothetical protein
MFCPIEPRSAMRQAKRCVTRSIFSATATFRRPIPTWSCRSTIVSLFSLLWAPNMLANRLINCDRAAETWELVGCVREIWQCPPHLPHPKILARDLHLANFHATLKSWSRCRSCVFKGFQRFNCAVIALDSMIRVLKPRAKLCLKFVRVLSASRVSLTLNPGFKCSATSA